MAAKKNLYGMEQKVESLAQSTGAKRSASRLEWMTPSFAVVVFALSGALMGLIDWALASPQQFARLSFGVSILTASAVGVLGAFVAIPLIAFVARFCESGKRVRMISVLTLCLAGLLPSAFLVPPLLAMPGVPGDQRLGLQIGLIGMVILLTLLASLVTTRAIIWPQGRAQTFKTAAGTLLFFALGFAAQYADATLFVGGYPTAHWLAAIAAAGSYCVGWTGLATFLEDRLPEWPKAFVFAGLVVVASCLGFHTFLRTTDYVHTVRAELQRPSFTVTRKVLSPLEQLILDHIVEIPELEFESRDDLADVALNPIIDHDQIDAILGNDRNQWNIVLLTADTLRYDVVGWSKAFKGEKTTTPHLDDLAKSSLILRNAATPYPTSNYAYSSMLTGYYPRFTPARRAFHPKSSFFKGESLTEVLKSNGYATWALTAFNEAGIRSDAAFGHLRPGFDVVNPAANTEVLDSAEVTAQALQKIENRDKDRPFFLWAHFMDAHAVYRKHPKFNFGDRPRDLYRGEVAYLDSQLEPLLRRLSKEDLENTVIVFVSDHGESFGEHDTSFHNSNLHFEQTRIPAFVKIPGVEPGEVKDAFNLVDLTPTLLSIVGIQDTERRQGRNLTDRFLRIPRDTPWIDFSYSERFPRDASLGQEMERSLIYEGGKIIRFAKDPSARHYDLVNDPYELKNNFDPSVEAQKTRLGFLDALDKKLDAFLGNSDPEAGVMKEIDKWLLSFSNDNQADDLRALIEIAKLLFDGDLRYRSYRGSKLGDVRKKTLHDALIKMSQSPFQPGPVHLACYEFLFNLPHLELQSHMRSLLKSSVGAIRVEAALWLMKRNDKSGFEILERSFGGANGELNLRIAPFMTQVRRGDTARWLVYGLNSDRSDMVVQSLDALSRIGHNDLDLILRELLSAPSFGMTLPKAQVALARAASRMKGQDADALLARLAQSPEPEARRLARKTLSLRLSPALVETRLTAAAQEMLGNESLNERRYTEALERLQQALKLNAAHGFDDVLLKLRIARTMGLVHREKEGIALMEPMTNPTSPNRPWIKASARNIVASLKTDPKFMTPLVEFKISGEMEKEATGFIGRQRYFFAREVEVTNNGKAHIPGGAWPWGNRFIWLFKNTTTGEWLSSGNDRRLPARFVPHQGIAPGETIRIVTIGRLPNPPGQWTPTLVLMREPWFSEDHKVILELPPVQIR